MWTTRVLLAAVLVVGVASSADARRRHHGYYGDGERSSGSNTLDQWRARQAQGQSGAPSRGDDRTQARSSDRGNDRGDDRTSRRGQDAQAPQSAGQDRSLGRAQDFGQDRARYDRRRYRESGDWRRYRDYRDERRRARDADRRRDPARDDVAPARAAAPADPALSGGRNGAFGATIDKLVRGCAAQAAEFANWPLDDISRTVAADENQRNALEALRGKAKAAGERLAADCPRDVPAAPVARLEAAEQGIAATLSALDTVEPALKAFYAALNDEQKAQLYRMAAKPAAPVATNPADTTRRREAQAARRARRDYSSRRHRWRDDAAARAAPARDDTAQRRAAKPGWNGSCEALSAVLRNWPVNEIERDVRLTTAQRVAFYELVTSSLKAADTLANACPAEAALTPVGRMQAMRQRLTAVRAATAAIRPALTRFYDALDQGQQQRFAGMS
jgi:hypothetical protein